MKIIKILSKENPIFKNALKLKNSKKYRDLKNLFLSEGVRLCLETIKSKVKVDVIFFTEKEYEKNANLFPELLKSDTKAYVLPENLFKKISGTVHSQGLIFVCEKSKKSFVSELNDLCFKKSNQENKILILENIKDPSNLGTILRTAETLGIKKIILSENCCDIYNPKVIRGSMGSIFRLSFHISKDLTHTITSLKENFKIPVYAATLSKNSIPIIKIKFPKDCAVVIGNEGDGITKETIEVCSFKIKIPISKNANSLNASSAASIIIWELIRERQNNYEKRFGNNLLDISV